MNDNLEKCKATAREVCGPDIELLKGSIPPRTIRVGKHKLVVPDDPRFQYWKRDGDYPAAWGWQTGAGTWCSLKSLCGGERKELEREWQSCCDRARCAWLDVGFELGDAKHEGEPMRLQRLNDAFDNAEAWRKAGEKR